MISGNSLRKYSCGGGSGECGGKGEPEGGLRTEMNVPGRNTIVTAAIVIIEELSRFVSKAIFAVRSAMSRFVLLST